MLAELPRARARRIGFAVGGRSADFSFGILAKKPFKISSSKLVYVSADFSFGILAKKPFKISSSKLVYVSADFSFGILAKKPFKISSSKLVYVTPLLFDFGHCVSFAFGLFSRRLTEGVYTIRQCLPRRPC